LAAKLKTLLAPANLFRASDLASVNLKSIVFAGNRISFALSRLRKAQKSGSMQSFSLRLMTGWRATSWNFLKKQFIFSWPRFLFLERICS
jgi:hypothetical protein